MPRFRRVHSLSGVSFALLAVLATASAPGAIAQPGPGSSARQVEELNALGLAQWRAGELEAALETLTRAVVLEPEWLPSHNHRSLVRAALGDFEGALADAEAAVELLPTLPLSDSERASVLDTRAYANLLLGRWDEALTDYDGAIGATVDTRPAHALGRGLVLLSLGQTRPGVSDLKWGTLLAPGYRSDPQVDDLLERAHLALMDLMSEYEPDGAEPDDTPEHAKPLRLGSGSEVRSLHTHGDVDWVSFDLQAGQGLVLFTNSPTCDTYLTLYAPDGRRILREDDDGGAYRDSVVEVVVRDAGTYYAEVRHFFAREGTCQSYRIGGVARSPR